METQRKFNLSRDESLFVRGSLSRMKELAFLFKIQYHFIKAFRKMHLMGHCVTVFGSARFTKDYKMEKAFRKIIIATCLFLLLSFDCPSQNEIYPLTIKVEDLRNSIGVVQFTLYNKEGSIPDEKFKASYKMQTAIINKETSTVTFKDLPKGRYAINILHDENENGKIDRRFILPIEGIGFSNYKSIGLTNRPNFSKASFVLDSAMIKLVKIIYL